MNSKSLEALNKMIEKYDWVGKEYCRLIGKNESLHKVNQEAFENLASTIKQDLERKEQLEKENQELRDKLNSQDLDIWQLHCKYGEYKKTIDILKNKVTFRWRNNQILEIVKNPWAKKTPKIAVITNYEEDEVLKKVLDE